MKKDHSTSELDVTAAAAGVVCRPNVNRRKRVTEWMRVLRVCERVFCVHVLSVCVCVCM